MTLQLEMINCGDCRRCLVGAKVHGPYWYDYWREGGKLVSEYVGRVVTEQHADSEHPVGSTPEDLYPERAAAMVQSAAADAETRKANLSTDQRAKLERVTSLQACVRKARRHRARSEDTATAEQFREEAEQHRAALVGARAELRAAVLAEEPDTAGA